LTSSGRWSRVLLLLVISPLLVAPGVSAASVGNSANPITMVAKARAAVVAGDASLAVRDLLSVASQIPVVAVVISDIQRGQLKQAGSQLAWLVSTSHPLRGAASDQAIGSVLRSIYRSPELAALSRRSPSGPSLLSSLATDVQQLLAALFHLVGNSVWILLGVVILVGGAALVAISLHRARSGLPEPEPAAESGRQLSAAIPPERLFARAETLREEGRFRESVRLAFQALLLSVANHRVLAVEPSWTNTELLRAARRVSDLEPQLRPLVSQFNAVVYGGRDPGADGCSRFMAACRAAAGSAGR